MKIAIATKRRSVSQLLSRRCSGDCSRSGMFWLCDAHATCSARLRMMRPLVWLARALNATATMIAAPEMASCQKGEMSMTGRAFLMTPKNSAPSKAPPTVPIPPAMETPANHAGRDHFQLKAFCNVYIGDRIARNPQISRNSCKCAGYGRGPKLGAAHVDASINRGMGIAADCIECTTQCGACHDKEEQNDGDYGDPTQHRNSQRLGPWESFECCAHFVRIDPFAIGDQKDDAAINGTWCPM